MRAWDRTGWPHVRGSPTRSATHKRGSDPPRSSSRRNVIGGGSRDHRLDWAWRATAKRDLQSPATDVIFLADEEAPGSDSVGKVVGTPGLPSPEQASGAKVDERADVMRGAFSTSKVLAGSPPHAACSRRRCVDRVLAGRRARCPCVVPSVPASSRPSSARRWRAIPMLAIPKRVALDEEPAPVHHEGCQRALVLDLGAAPQDAVGHQRGRRGRARQHAGARRDGGSSPFRAWSPSATMLAASGPAEDGDQSRGASREIVLLQAETRAPRSDRGAGPGSRLRVGATIRSKVVDVIDEGAGDGP